MVEERIDTQAYDKEPLDKLAKKIDESANQAFDHVTKTAMMILAAQKRVENGEAGKVNWADWVNVNLKIGESRVRELLCIAKADNPQQELDNQRQKNARRQAKHRAKKEVAGEETKASAPLRNGAQSQKVEADITATANRSAQQIDEKQQVMDWAQNASQDDLRKVLDYIKDLKKNTGDGNDPSSAKDPSAA